MSVNEDEDALCINNCKEIYKMYSDIFSHDVHEYENEITRLVLPTVPAPILMKLLQKATDIFSKEPNMLVINGDIFVVGDLHGHILDLFRILKNVGVPPEKNYLFLGDFIDRGEFSTETITLILVLKVLFPENVNIIRGNHEFPEMFTRCGFSNEVDSIYESTQIREGFHKAFSYMPLAALVNDENICVHGGIGPTFSTLGQISDAKRPLFTYDDNELITCLVWSDPTSQFDEYAPSSRGSGFLFGKESLSRLLKSQVLTLLVRGHECVNDGIEYSLNNQCCTVFSASNYCGMLNNKAGVLLLKNNKERESIIFPSLKYFYRNQARFVESEDDFEFKVSPQAIEEIISKMPLPTLGNRKIKVSESHSHSQFETLRFQKRLSLDRGLSGRNIQSQCSYNLKRKPLDVGVRSSQTTRTISLKKEQEGLSSIPSYAKFQPVIIARTQPTARRTISNPGEQFPAFQKP